MKPARSATATASLPHEVANSVAVAMVSSLAVSGRMISTSFIIGAGLKKCTPHTRSGRCVAMANSTTGRVEVLVAMMASALSTPSSSATSARFTARSSTTDSMTRSQSARSANWSVAVMRPRMAVRSSSVALPRSTALARLRPRPLTIASALDWVRERTTTSYPARAATSARPAPMMPDPITPTRLTVAMSGIVPTHG